MQHRPLTVLHFIGLAILSVIVAVTVELGHNATLPCRQNCSKVEWKTKIGFNVSRILQFAEGKLTVAPEYMGRLEFSEENVKSGDVSITLSSVVYNDQRWYYCSCDGKDQCDKKIEVLVPHPVSVFIGGKATLPCYAETAKQTPVSVLWQKDGEMVFELKNGKMVYGSGFEQRATVSAEGYKKGDLSLTINDTRYSDAGLYRCSLNDGEYGYPNSVTLAVEAHQFQHTKLEGDSVELELVVPDLLEVNFKADANTTDSCMCTRRKDAVNCTSVYEQRTSFLNNTLMLHDLSLSDSGTYRILDNNSKVIAIHKLKVMGSPSYKMSDTAISVLCFAVTAFLTIALWVYYQIQRKRRNTVDETRSKDENMHLSVPQCETSDGSPQPFYEMSETKEVVTSSSSQPTDQDANTQS